MSESNQVSSGKSLRFGLLATEKVEELCGQIFRGAIGTGPDWTELHDLATQMVRLKSDL